MPELFLFLRRDCRLMIQSPQVVILPLCYFWVSLFLIRFMMPQLSQHILQMFWVLLLLSTLGTLGQTVAKDKGMGFLKALDQRLLPRYLLSKGVSLAIVWILPYWGLYGMLSFVMGQQVSIGHSLVAFGCFLTPLAFLYVLFDTLLERSSASALLSLVLFVPFMVPLLIFASLCLSVGGSTILGALLSYGLFLSGIAGLLAAYSAKPF